MLIIMHIVSVTLYLWKKVFYFNLIMSIDRIFIHVYPIYVFWNLAIQIA